LSQRDIVQPDALLIARERLGIVRQGLIEGPPDLVVKIVSPSTRPKDRIEKAELYARSGVCEYWQVDPRHRSVIVLALRDGIYVPQPVEDGVARSVELPGLTVDVTALFADLT
jgi:Uma2 family endonuclease